MDPSRPSSDASEPVAPVPAETAIAQRAYTVPRPRWKRRKDGGTEPVALAEEEPEDPPATDDPAPQAKPWVWPEVDIVFDTETHTDQTQRLLFGWYQIRRRGVLYREGPISADDLTSEQRDEVARYVAGHSTDDGQALHPLSRGEFVDYVLWGYAYEAKAMLACFNAPFDLSRVAIGAFKAKGGAYRLRFWRRSKSNRDERAHKFRPDIRIQAIDARRQFIQFSAPEHIDPENLGHDGKPFRGNLLDVKTLAYAFSDKNLSLASAAKRFGCRQRKWEGDLPYGEVSERAIEYCRQDVRVTAELLDKLHEEYERHPVSRILPATRLVSAAGVGKGYLSLMGITPLVERAGEVPKGRLGQAMTAYFGGRVETVIRRTDLPCVYLDAVSMYSSVFGLSKLWRLITAAALNVEDATDDAQRFVDLATRERLLDPLVWPDLAGVFCRVQPAGHRLPVRARFQPRREGEEVEAGGAFQIAVTELDANGADCWYALADLVACKVLTGDAPTVLEAFRIAASEERIPTSPVRLRGEVEIDPAGEDFFQRLIEIRKGIEKSSEEGRRLDQLVKTLASSAAYGIFAETRELPEVGGRGATVDVWARRRFHTSGVRRPEEPGRFCYPPVASTVTACARLLLALCQAEVEAAGGHFVTGDTDSLVVVGSREGGVEPCEGGGLRTADGRPGIRALSWAEVDQIRERLNRLNPYDRGVVRDLLELEKENHDRHDSKIRVDLRCVAVSPKRYALFEVKADGSIDVRRPSQHGLGFFLPPAKRPQLDDADEEVKEGWADTVWRRIIAEVRGEDPGPEPEWFESMAPSRAAITRWRALDPYRRLNARRRYPRRIKPANFLLVAHDDPLSPLPAGLDRDHLTPIAPFSTERSEWPRLPWRNRWDGGRLRLTANERRRPGEVRVKTYRDIVTDHARHPDPKMSARDGGHVRRGTVGLLMRTPVLATGVRYVGKEAARLDEEEPGMLRLADEPYATYESPAEDAEAIMPRIRYLKDTGVVTIAELVALTGRHERTVQGWLNSGRVPRDPAVVPRLQQYLRARSDR